MGIVKIKFPSFRDISLRYLNEVSIHKKCYREEHYTINSFEEESWSEYPINKITHLIIGKYRNKLFCVNHTFTICDLKYLVNY